MQTTTSPDLTAAAQAEFVQSLKLAHVPPDVQQRALHLMLDTIGCALAARREDFAVRLAAAIGGFGHGETGSRGVIGFARPLPLRDAIWLNGALMHGLDYDDTHMAGVLHLSVGVLPAILGLGAQRGASGAAVLASYIAGLETGARVASVVKGGLHAQGFHPTGLVGTFAAALAAGHLLGLNARQLVAAQGFALSMAGGSLQFLEDGAWTKRLHPGWAAQAGVQAAWLAAQDIPAPPAPYEGRFGLFHAYLDRSLQEKIDLSLAQRGFGAVWELQQIAIKPFPMCHFVHAAADAAIALNAQGIQPEQVQRIDALMPAGTMPVVCEPITTKRRPQTDYDAKFSLPYAVASGLIHGRLGLRELRREAFTDAAAQALMDRVYCEVDPESTFPRHYGATLRVSLMDGRVLVQREPVNRGHAERPLSNADIQAKYMDNAALHFGKARAEALRDTILQMPSLSDLRQLEALLAREPELAT